MPAPANAQPLRDFVARYLSGAPKRASWRPKREPIKKKA